MHETRSEPRATAGQVRAGPARSRRLRRLCRRAKKISAGTAERAERGVARAL